MKQIFLSILKKGLAPAVIAACSLGALTLPSCSKSSNNSGTTTNYAAPFLGTWTGITNTCGSTGGTFTFSAGSNGNTFTEPGTVGAGTTACPLKNIVITCVATSTTAFTIPSTTYTDNCGLSYTITGGGTLSGNTLTVSVASTGAVTANCTSTCTK